VSNQNLRDLRIIQILEVAQGNAGLLFDRQHLHQGGTLCSMYLRELESSLAVAGPVGECFKDESLSRRCFIRAIAYSAKVAIL